MEFSIPYGKQEITDQDIKAVVDTLNSDFLTQGPKIEEFEKEFAKYIGCEYAVAVANGTAALHLCALALEINKNTNVITSPITFAASANCVRYCEGNVYFADIDPEIFTVDIDKIETLILSMPKDFFHGIIPVDFSGYAVDMEILKKLAEKYNLWIIEDACHAPGGYFTDSAGVQQKCGNGKFADLSIFSFHPVKHIACGEGGMITTNDKTLYEKIKILRTHGITKDPLQLSENHGAWYYEMITLGYNYRITDFQAALGISQLKRADTGLNRRKEIAAVYNDFFKDKDYISGQSTYVSGHAYHLYIIKVSKRKELHDYLRTKNIFTQIHYIPVHTFPYYQSLGNKKGYCPHAENYYNECLSLPIYPSLTNEEQQYVIDEISCFFEKNN